jgi:hypothetical protein
MAAPKAGAPTGRHYTSRTHQESLPCACPARTQAGYLKSMGTHVCSNSKDDESLLQQVIAHWSLSASLTVTARMLQHVYSNLASALLPTNVVSSTHMLFFGRCIQRKYFACSNNCSTLARLVGPLRENAGAWDEATEHIGLPSWAVVGNDEAISQHVRHLLPCRHLLLWSLALISHCVQLSLRELHPTRVFM